MTSVIDYARFYVCEADEMANNDIRQIKPPGRDPVALYRVGDSFHATDDICSHGQALLSEGDVDDDFVVECPWHGGTFDIRTGEALSFPCVLPVRSYPVLLEDGKIYLNLHAGETKE